MSDSQTSEGAESAAAQASTELTTGEGGAVKQDRPAGLPSTPERELWAGRGHWSHYADRLCLTVFSIILVFVLKAWAGKHLEFMKSSPASWIVWILVFGAVLVVGGQVLWFILAKRYRLTSQRLFVEIGVLSKTTDQTELVRVDDVRVMQRVIERMLNVGNVEVSGTDATSPKTILFGVKDPHRVAEIVRDNMRLLRSRTVFVESV